MKTRTEIQQYVKALENSRNSYPQYCSGRTRLQGVVDVLKWVLDDTLKYEEDSGAPGSPNNENGEEGGNRK